MSNIFVENVYDRRITCFIFIIAANIMFLPLAAPTYGNDIARRVFDDVGTNIAPGIGAVTI